MPFSVMQWSQIAPRYWRGTILLGNGASMAVSQSFRYGSLLEHAFQNGLVRADVNRIFEFFRTSDFELILRLVWQASNVNRALGIQDDRTHQVYTDVRAGLIQAVREVHPVYESVSSQLPQMYQFLKTFDTVLSLNYDLLVYWAMTYGLDVCDGHQFKDCFVQNGLFDDAWAKFVIITRSTQIPWCSILMEVWPLAAVFSSRSSRSAAMDRGCWRLSLILGAVNDVCHYLLAREQLRRKFLRSGTATTY